MIYNTYIQQLGFNGVSYSSGTTVNIYSKFHVICQDFPFKKNPEIKELPTRDWAGEDGLDVYIPDVIPLKEYEVEATFLYEGKDSDIRTNVSNFINFICGREKGNNSDSVKSGRLAIYDDYVGMGRKDVVVKKIENEFLYLEGSDENAHAQFRVTFMVYDPSTEVTKTTTTVNGVTTTILSFVSSQ